MNDEYENMKQELEDDWTVNELNFHPAQMVGADKLDTAPAVVPSVSAGAKEDWTMDMSTNEMPAQETNGKWQMPEPVFRISDGKKIEKSKSAALPLPVSPPTPPEIAVIDAAPANIQPQPYISEAFAVDDEYTIEEPPAKAESGNKRKILVIIGVLAMAFFAIAFLVGVYFLFFHNKPGV